MQFSEYIHNFSLKFKNNNAEREYNIIRNKDIINLNINFCIYFFILNSLNTILLLCSLEKPKFLAKKNMITYVHISYSLLAVSIILLVMSKLIKKCKIQKLICYVTYLGLLFPIYNINSVIWEIHLEDKDLYSIIILFGLGPRAIMKSLQMLSLPECVIMSILEIPILMIYYYFTNQFTRIFVNLGIFPLQITLSYAMTRKYKESLLYVWASNEKKRYQNIFENMKSCFLNFSNKKFKFVNKNFQEIIMKNKTIKTIHKSSKINSMFIEHRKNLFNLYEKTKENLDENESLFIEAHSELILNILIQNIMSSSEETSNNNIDSLILFGENNIDKNVNKFSLDKFLSSIKETYISKEMKGNFIFLGFKEMKLIFDDESDKIIKRKYEVYYRVIIEEEEEYELMFNDISDIQENEEKLAEVKYKSMFLSKVAHEFKNPLICIGELVNQLDILSKSIDKNEFYYKSPEILKQIQSMSEYLIILIKDLDYFSNIQINKDPQKLEIAKVDLKNNLIPFCTQIGQSLINKLNKNKVNISVENNLPTGMKFKTDEIKLKQILINLISNAVKFTNQGTIKLRINLVVVQNKIVFEVSDSGIGMDIEQLQNLGNPFKKGSNSGNKNKYGSGLGLYVVSQILSQLGSELQCNSEVGRGTTFSFSLKAYTFTDEDSNVYDSSHQSDSFIAETNSKFLTIKLEEEDHEEINQVYLNYAREQLRRPSDNKSTYFNTIKENRNNPDCLNIETTENLLSNLSTSYYILVDDEKFTRQATLRVLKQTANKLKINCLFIEAEDGIECLSMVYSLLKDGKKISGIISDEMMNHMNGSTTAEILKKLKNLNSQHIPFYLLSALTDFNNSFIDIFISKPLNEKEAKKIFIN